MALYAIGDTHLSLSSAKPMDVFGGRWENYMEKFRSEMQEYEQFSRRSLFEEIVNGDLSIEECYLRASQLNMDIQGPCYNLVLYSIQSKRENPGEGDNYFVDIYRFVMDFDESDVCPQEAETDGFMLATVDEIKGFADQGIFLHYDSIKQVFEL